MKNIIVVIVTGLWLGLVSAPGIGASSDEASIYFNAGMEKYLQGNFTESVENLEKAQSLDPGNAKTAELMVKILLEAATQNHLNRNYRQAYAYLQKAKTIAPENQKVNEMHQLTRELLTPSAEKTLPKEKPAVPPQAVKQKEEPSQNAEAPRNIRREATNEIRARQPTGKPVTGMSQAKDREMRVTGSALSRLRHKHLMVGIVWLGMSNIVLFILALLYYYAVRRVRKTRKEIHRLEDAARQLTDEKNRYLLEMEKAREGVKYEHRIAENTQKELKEMHKREEERIKNELDSRSRQMEERIKADVMRNNRGNAGSPDEFYHRQEEKFLKYVNDATNIDAEASPAVESTRERIALMAQNLYEYAPGAAIDFLNKMAKNENALVRSNVIHALAYMGRQETLEILLSLYRDPDMRVKREVLKNLKQLQQKIAAGAVSIDAVSVNMIRQMLEEEKSKGEWIF